MLYFVNDYSEGAHEKILRRLTETNLVQESGYGSDSFTASATKKINEACSLKDAEVFFLSGGTQTNMTVISSVLQPYEGAIAATTGHIAAHEAGTIEYHGHKVLEVPSYEGKVKAQDVKAFIEKFYGDDSHEHMVFPGMLYVSHPTEYGTLYTKEELTALSSLCKEKEIPLFLDGARLAYGLMAEETDLTLSDIASLCDIFYIGGTKCGALCGEAVVFSGRKAPKYFMTMMKKHGALLAKGRLCSVQFETLFTGGLYEEIGLQGIETAMALKTVLKSYGFRFFLDSPTNQQFVILENGFLEKLKEQVAVSFWEQYDETHTVVRFATSWATTMEQVEALDEIIRGLV